MLAPRVYHMHYQCTEWSHSAWTMYAYVMTTSTITAYISPATSDAASPQHKTMLTGGIALISCLKFSAIVGSFQLRELPAILRNKLSTSNFHYNSSRSGIRYSPTLYDSGFMAMLSRRTQFKATEQTKAKQEHKTFQLTLAETPPKSIAYADWLNVNESAEKQYEYVKSQKFMDSEDPELLWRFGRACHCIYTYSNAAKEVKAAAIWDGLSAVEKAVLADSKSSNAFVVSHIATHKCS